MQNTFARQIRALPTNFWCASFMEFLERLAFFGVRAVAPLYLVRTAGENGLGLDFRQKGVIFSVWALLQCLIPLVSGAYTDRYGYRKSFMVALTICVLGYLGMAQSKAIADVWSAHGWEDAAFWVFLAAACLVGTGTAVFKPAIGGTIARCAREETSSLCWGVFYWVVNVGSAVAPMCAAVLRVEINWDNVFYAAAMVTAVNFIPAWLLYKEPQRPAESLERARGRSFLGVLVASLREVAGDRRLILFLSIFSGFWLMFMQLWDLLPNFIDEWVDSSDVAPLFGWFNQSWVQTNGRVKPEMILSMNSLSILILVIPISGWIGRMNKIPVMMIGMAISVVGFVGTGTTELGWLCCLMLLLFSVGEMLCTPTFSAYMGLIAPTAKKALYMGYSNIPYAIGWASGGALGGVLYERFASKAVLARRYLVDELGMDPSQVISASRVSPHRAIDSLASALGTDETGASRVLWEAYHPWVVWCYLGGIGLAATVGMTLFYLSFRKGPGKPREYE